MARRSTLALLWALGGGVAFLPGRVVAAAETAPPSGRPWLGLVMDAPAPGAAGGAHVGHVVRGSPAQAAGVREGDRIVRVGAAAVASSADVVRAIAAYAVGDVVPLALVRDAGTQTVRATLAPFPSQEAVMRMDLLGAPAPELVDASSAAGVFPASLAELRGRVVLLDFWATWCAPCRAVAPQLDGLQSRYGAQGLSVLGLSSEEPSDIASFARAMGLRYGMGVDHRGKTSRAYGVGSLPTMVVIDKHGVVRDLLVGYDPAAEAALEGKLRALMAEP